MELRFRISAEQCQALADRIAANRIARITGKRDALQARLEALVQRWMGRLLLVAPLGGAVLLTLHGTPRQQLIGTVFALVVISLVYGLLWWFCSAALVRLIVRMGQWLNAKVRLATRPLLARITQRSVQRSMARLEGLHVWSVSPAALSVQGPAGKAAQIPWQNIARLHDLGDFYQVFTGTSARFGLAYYLAKSSTEMDAHAYGDGLRLLLEHAPAAST